MDNEELILRALKQILRNQLNVAYGQYDTNDLIKEIDKVLPPKEDNFNDW